ncbi:40835_t:CDS:2 [Gigaspora margarita]|uniref:40835_t:CDS:1 n=1 Tax=Gigaspora margarita TaxID=4874 RepID=A0ABN7UYW1_GIGMA|nr:40835_t:CDS:2 [Gigaspora margarita]
MAYFPNNGQINMSGATTDWRLHLSEDERKINVGRLYKGLELLNQPPTYRFHISKQWENDSYNSANSKDEYNQLIGAKLRELTTKIQRTAQIRQQQQTQRNAAPSQQPQVAQQQSQQAQTLLPQQLQNSQPQQLQQQILTQTLQQQQQPVPSPQQQQQAQAQRFLLQQRQLLQQQQINAQQTARQQQIYQQLLQNPALQQNQLRRMQLQRQSQQPPQQLQATPQQIAAVSNNFIRPPASQVPSSPKPTQPGAHRLNLLPPQVLNALGIPPDTQQVSPEVLKRINAYMAMVQQQQQAAQQSNAQQDGTMQSPVKVNPQSVSNVAGPSMKLPSNVAIQSPVNPMKGQAPSQSPGAMFLMTNAGPSITNSLGTTPSQSPAIVNSSPIAMSNKTTPNMSPNAASTKLAAANLTAPQLKIPQNKLVSPAVQNASVAPNLGIKVPSGVGIQNLGLMSGFQGANATIGRPNVMMHTAANSAANANTIMLVNSNNTANQGIVASNGAKAAAMNAIFANTTRPSTQPLNVNAMSIINNSTTQPGSLATLTEKEEKEALAMISQIDSRAREKNIQYHEIDLSEEDKRQIRIKLQELTPLYKKVDEVLPYFWHYTRSSQGTYRLLGMKYMIEDQLNALPSGKYLLKLDLVENLLLQFRKYFDFVDSRRRGIEDTSGFMNFRTVVPPQQPQPNVDSLLIRPRINSSDLKLPVTQRHVNDSSGTSGSSSIPPKKRQSSVDQDIQQSNKRQQTDSNSINRTTDGPQNISAEILTTNTTNQNNPIVIPDDVKPTSSEVQESDKNGVTTEDYHAGSQLLTNRLNKLKSISVMRSGPTMVQRQMIEGYSPCEESEQRAIMVSLINTA